MIYETEVAEKKPLSESNAGSNFAIDPDTLDAFCSHQVENFKVAMDSRANEIIEGAEKWATVTELTDATEAKANDFLDVVKAYENTVAAEHKRLKAPYHKAGSAFDAAKREMLPKVDKPKKIITALINDLLNRRRKKQEEEARKAQQEADRISREAAEKRKAAEAEGPAGFAADIAADEAEAAAADAQKAAKKVANAPVQTRGSAGKARSQRTTYVENVTDWMKAFRCVKDHPDVQAAVRMALRQRYNANRALAAKGHPEKHFLQGVEFTTSKKAS